MDKRVMSMAYWARGELIEVAHSYNIALMTRLKVVISHWSFRNVSELLQRLSHIFRWVRLNVPATVRPPFFESDL
jgi:hypothetical protein